MGLDRVQTPSRRVLLVATVLVVAVAAGVGFLVVGTDDAALPSASECRVLDEGGTYELTSNVTRTGDRDAAEPCIRVTASDVTVDGDGHTVGPADPASDNAFFVADGDGRLRNVTLRDARFEGTDPTLRFENVTGARVANVSVRSVPPGANDLPTPGRIRVVGDGNTITNTTGLAAVSVVGDDNRILGTETTGGHGSPSLSVDGDGNLARNVTASGVSGAVVSGADNRVTNGWFRSITGDGLRIDNATDTLVVDSEASNVVLTNSTGASIRGADIGIYDESGWVTVDGSDGNELVGTEGISTLWITDSDGNVVRGNTITDTVAVGEGSASNLLYDNRIRVSGRGDFAAVKIGPDAGANAWNVTPRPGENVLGGDTVAGNAYVNAEGTGFTRWCADADDDGVCDSPGEFGTNNTDYAPLSNSTEGGDSTDETDDESFPDWD